MTLEEARSHIGHSVLYSAAGAAKAAVAIEHKVLRRWRHDLGLPSYLKHEQMSQGGWTETVATGRIDLAATVGSWTRHRA